MQSLPRQPADSHGAVVAVGQFVRVLGLSGEWFDELPADERTDVGSMIGQVFAVEQIDGHGHTWVRKSWPNEVDGTCHSHAVALEPHEMELVSDHEPRT